jgi:hypothetical protein
MPGLTPPFSMLAIVRFIGQTRIMRNYAVPYTVVALAAVAAVLMIV